MEKLEFTDSPYLDSMIDEIYEDENGNYVYNSEVFTEREMAKVPEWAIVVYKIVHNWREI